jgi:hypothetical protein
MFFIVDFTWVWIVRSCLNSHVSESHCFSLCEILPMMWWIRNAIVATHTFTLKIFINCIQLAFNREKYNLSFIKTIKWRFLFSFFFLLEIFDQYFLFSNTFFSFFQPKKLGQNPGFYLFFGWKFNEKNHFVWKISPIFWYHKFSKEKNHPFTTTFFYLHTLINYSHY